MKSPAMVALLTLLLAASVLASLASGAAQWIWLLATLILYPLALGAAGLIRIRRTDTVTPACASIMALFTLALLIPGMREADEARTAREWIVVAVDVVSDIVLLVMLWRGLFKRWKGR